MARIRTIKPEYWSDEAVGSVSIPARLMFPATWNFADDEGLINWSPTYLKASIFPYDQEVSVEDVAGWMKELEDADFVYVYATTRSRNRVAFIINFRDHQRIDKPQCAKLPVPNWRDPNVVMVYARRTDFVCAACTEPVNEDFATDADGRRRDPICQRIKPASERPSAPDDPSNIEVVHVACAKDFDPGAPLTPIRGPFHEHSRNDPGALAERSSDLVSPGLPVSPTFTSASTESHATVTHLPRETAGQVIPGTLVERSPLEGKGREKEQEGKEEPPATPAALFDAPTDQPEASRADKPRRPSKPKRPPKEPKEPKPLPPADELTNAFWEVHGRGQAQSWVAIRAVVRTVLANDVPRNDVACALDRLAKAETSISGGTVQNALRDIRRERQAAENGSNVVVLHQGRQIPGQRVSATRRAVDEAEAAGEEAKRMLAAMRANGGSPYPQIGSGA